MITLTFAYADFISTMNMLKFKQRYFPIAVDIIHVYGGICRTQCGKKTLIDGVEAVLKLEHWNGRNTCEN